MHFITQQRTASTHFIFTMAKNSTNFFFFEAIICGYVLILWYNFQYTRNLRYELINYAAEWGQLKIIKKI